MIIFIILISSALCFFFLLVFFWGGFLICSAEIEVHLIHLCVLYAVKYGNQFSVFNMSTRYELVYVSRFVGSSSGVVFRFLDCSRKIHEFEHASSSNVYFPTNTLRKGVNPFILHSNELKSIFDKDSFSIKWPMKVDMPLNKETKSNLVFDYTFLICLLRFFFFCTRSYWIGFILLNRPIWPMT